MSLSSAWWLMEKLIIRWRLSPELRILRKTFTTNIMCICTKTNGHIHPTYIPNFPSGRGYMYSSRRRSMMLETQSRKAPSLEPGRTESRASSTISSMTDIFLTVSLHIKLPMTNGVSPFSEPFFRSIVEMRNTRAQSFGSSHPWNLSKAMSISASIALIYSRVSVPKGWRAWGQ